MHRGHQGRSKQALTSGPGKIGSELHRKGEDRLV